MIGNHSGFLNKQLDRKQHYKHDDKSNIAIEHINKSAQSKQSRQSAHDDHRISMSKLAHQQMVQVTLIRFHKSLSF